jgi:PAT family acetyl-CoA transporter-like MFS transporter 1
MSLLTLPGYPIIFKWIVAPIVDTYYIKRIGRRKTYLIGIGFILSIMLFILSFYITDWIKNEDINKIVFYGIIFNSLATFKTVADFGFLVSNFRPQV